MWMGVGYAGDAVFGEHHDAGAVAAGVGDEVARHRVDFREAFRDARVIGTEPLQVVVEVREVNERKRGRAGAPHVQRRVGDPARRGDVGGRPPEMEQRERPKLRGQLLAQLQGLRVAIGELAAVGLVDRTRRDAHVVARSHIVPPEQIGGGEGGIATLTRLPDFFAGDEAVRLAPQPYLQEIAEEPAVADDAVLTRQAAGHERRLHRAGDGGHDGRERPHRPGARERAELGRVRAEMARREANHEKDDRRTHGRHSQN